MRKPDGSSALAELIARLVEMARKLPPQQRVEFLEVMLLASRLQEEGAFETPVYQLSRNLLREAMEASLGDELAPEQIDRVTSTVMALLHLNEGTPVGNATMKKPRSKDHSKRG